jgi:hypothetical protein
VLLGHTRGKELGSCVLVKEYSNLADFSVGTGNVPEIGTDTALLHYVGSTCYW